MQNRELEPVLSRLPQWERFFDGRPLPPMVRDRQAASELQPRVIHLRRRLRDGPQAPMRLAFFGPTGTGKSKLFSSLLGRNVSNSGYRRPFTRRSLYYLHDHWKSLSASLPGDVYGHTEEPWRGVILIDTPDFDSVERDNRREAERMFLEADAFVFVTDALKYADAATWEYLRRIYAARKSFLVVLNKVSSDAVIQSFEERFRRTFSATLEETDLAGGLVIVPEFRIDDETLIDASEPAIRNLHTSVNELLAHDRLSSPSRLLRGEIEGLSANAHKLRDDIRRCQQLWREFRDRLQLRYAEAVEQLERRLVADLEPAVREEVYNRVLNRLEAMDLLRYPRKLLSLPARGLKALVLRMWPGREETQRAEQEGTPHDAVSAETFHVLESELIRFADQSRGDFLAEPELAHLLSRDQFRELRLSHTEVQQQYAEHQAQFAEWVAEQARDTAAQITSENKAKFILSQVLFNTVLITAQVHTGGISPLELGLDGVVTPFVAKAVGMAIGNEKVKEFERAAHAEHQRSLALIMALGRDRFVQFLERSAEGLDAWEQTLSEIVDSRPALEKLVARFAAGDLTSSPPPGLLVDGEKTE